jgi:hypothetical protein
MRTLFICLIAAAASLGATVEPGYPVTVSGPGIFTPRPACRLSAAPPLAPASVPCPFRLASRTETDDYVQYGTDAEPIPTPHELQEEEKQKEERSWQMLERMEVYKPLPGKNSTKQSTNPQ